MDQMTHNIYELVSNDLNRSVLYMRRNVERFALAREQGCYGALKQFEIIHSAEHNLPPHFFAHFCEQLGLIAGSPEVKILSKLGERSQRIYFETGESIASAKLYLVTSTSEDEFEKYAKAAAAFVTMDVEDLRDGTIYQHLHKS